MLRLVDPELAISLYNAYVERIRTDFEAGRREALAAIGRCGEDIEASHLVVTVGIAVAKADSVFSADEVAIVEEICRCINIAGLDIPGLAGMQGGAPLRS